MTASQELWKGLWVRHPVFRMTLALCTTLAVSTRVENGVAMGAATVFVLTASNGVVSSLRGWVPSRVRIPVYLVVIATFVTAVEMSLKAFLPSMHAALGIYLPLVTVNCIVLARADSFSSRNTVPVAMADGLGMGLGYTWGIVAISVIRELLGTGSLGLGDVVLVSELGAMELLVQPSGGFLVIGLFLGGLSYLRLRRKAQRKEREGGEGASGGGVDSSRGPGDEGEVSGGG